LREPVRGVVLGHVVDIDHRCGDVRVAQIRLHIGERERLHGQRPERVPQVVKAHPFQPGALERRHEAPPES
jgi:hypothetical protein